MTVPLPVEFTERMKAQLNGDYDAFIDSLRNPAPVSIRLNPEKYIDIFDKDEKVPWCNEGRYLSVRPSFTFDPYFHAGGYYVQEASSMYLEQVMQKILANRKNLRILDLSAAPGGKSSHILNLISSDSLLVSNEIIPARNIILQQNLVKWGYSNVIVSQNQPSDFKNLKDFFDIILVDAPCSGEGLFRKDKAAINEWSIDNVNRCSIRQENILNDILPCLKPGGHLIYSTCTFEPSENDQRIEAVLKSHPDFVSINLHDSKFNSNKTKYGEQFYPHKIKGEGFYIATVKRNENEEMHQQPSAKIKTAEQFNSLLEEYLDDAADFIPMLVKDVLYAIPHAAASVYTLLAKELYIRQAGICMGSMKGEDFIPVHDLALSNHLRHDILSLSLNEEEAIRYLKCESIPQYSSSPGWYTVNFQSFPLGWAKVLNTRVNNYFPRNLRILKSEA